MPRGIVHAAARIADRHNLRFFLREQSRHGRAHVAEALNGDRRAAQGNLFDLARFLDHVEASAPGGVAAPFGAADRNRLAGHDAGRRVSHGHGVGVHDPGHGLRVGVNVGRGNIDLRTDDRLNFRGVAARHALEFALGHALGIADDAALGPAVREIDRGGLPGHPRGERLSLHPV